MLNFGFPEIIILAILCIPLIAGIVGILFAIRSRQKPATSPCPRCGTANRLGSRYCSNCGENLASP
jgi:hypothetical protein